MMEDVEVIEDPKDSPGTGGDLEQREGGHLTYYLRFQMGKVVKVDWRNGRKFHNIGKWMVRRGI